MSIKDIDFPTFGESHNGQHHVGHTHFWDRALLSRRQFMTAAAATSGIVLGSGLWMPGLAQAGENAPRPIPTGFTFNGKFFHLDPMSPGVTENSSIYDFHGSIGAAIVDGTGTATNTETGVTQSLTFDTDMRFMKGVYIGMDGEKHQGTFSFIWLDLYEGQVVPGDFSNQVHDFNPGIARSGLFWTIRVPDETIEVDLDDARATIDLRDVDVGDYHNIPNALSGGPSIPSTVSFHLRWSGVKQRVHLHDNQKKFDAQLMLDTATLAWSARSKDFKFESDPAHTSTTIFAALGRERNGVFFS